MTIMVNPEELTDTIGILPTHNVLDEVVVYGVHAGKFRWTLKPITKEEIAAMNYNRRGINVDVIGGIMKLFTYKKRKRQKKAKKILAEY